MKKLKIDAYLIPSEDDHASEYVNDHFRCIEWITGFTGSAGTVLITAGEAWLWTDGRYFLQAEDQLRGTGAMLMKMNEPGVPTINEKISELAAAAECSPEASSKPSKKHPYTLGFDGSTMTAAEGEKIEKECPVSIVYSRDLIGSVWEDRPQLKPSRIWEFPLTSSGKTFEDKLADVRQEMAARGADVLLICDLMETAWLFDLRGGDVLDTPVFYSYAIVTEDECWLFTLPRALTPLIKGRLTRRGVTVRNYNKVSDVLESLTRKGETLWADKEKTSYLLIKNVQRARDMTAHFASLFSDVAEQLREEPETFEQENDENGSDEGGNEAALKKSKDEPEALIDKPTPIEMMKAVKSETEIAATEHAHLMDGVAVAKFIYWLKGKAGELADKGEVSQETPGVTAEGKLTELSCCEKLASLRHAQEGCFDLSFPTIAGYMSNGAIIHYEPTPESDTEIKADGVLLVDSGGQYIDGTTDITRTIAVGPLSDKLKKYYTLVLKGHIDLAMARFPRGTTGKELDVAARKPLQDAGLDYNHGTGHGVGHVLSVHEGPNYISYRNGGCVFLPGMITSDEPGVYIEGEFGIRIESEILCVRAADQPDAVYQDLAAAKDKKAAGRAKAAKADDGRAGSADQEMLGFKDITLAPLEREAILPEMLTEKERAWLNSYHERVYQALAPHLTDEEAAWLREATLPL